MRKWIDMLNEFYQPEDEPEGGGDGPEMVRVTGICWYKDNEDQDEVYSNDLPTEVTIPVDADPDDAGSQMMLSVIENELEARYGFRHNARPMFFEYTFV